MHQWEFSIMWIVPLDPSGFKCVLVITIFVFYSKEQIKHTDTTTG